MEEAGSGIRRFLLHVLPKGLGRIRHYGWMANPCRRQQAALVRTLLGIQAAEPASVSGDNSHARRCPICGGAIEVVEMIVPRELAHCRPSRGRAPATS
jgi:hypothetical protein